MANPNTNKTKNWIYRLRQLSIRRNTEDTINDDFTTVVFRRQASDSDTTTCSRTRNSFRKSLRKMHTRVKSVFMNNSAPPSSRHTIHISSSASSQPRVRML